MEILQSIRDASVLAFDPPSEIQDPLMGFNDCMAGAKLDHLEGGHGRTLSRRNFLQQIPLIAAYPFLQSPYLPVAPIPQQQDSYIAPVLFGDIPVYGHTRPIQDPETVQAIVQQDDEVMIPGVHAAYSQLSRESFIQWRKTQLPGNERFIDVIVPDSVYHAVPNMDGAEHFAGWFGNHVRGLNEILLRDVPGLDLSCITHRILVIDDNLAPLPTRSQPNEPSIGWKITVSSDDPKWYHDTLGRLPLTSDLRVHFEKDYLDTRSWMSMLRLGDGEDIPFDSGLIHHYLHNLFLLPDWYWHDGTMLSRFKYLQDIHAYRTDMMSAIPTVNSISPASALHILAAVNRFGFRGNYADALPTTFTDREIPREASFSFFSSEGAVRPEISGLYSYSSVYPPGKDFSDHHANRKYAVSSFPMEIQHENNRVDLTYDVMKIADPYLFVALRIGDQKLMYFPFPRLLLRLAAWQGIEHPEFTIETTDRISPVGKRLSLKTVWKKDFAAYEAKAPGLFASCDIPGTDARHVWEWREDTISPTALTKTCLTVGAAATLAYFLLKK